MKYLPLLLLCISCSVLTIEHYNELEEAEKDKYQINKIDLENHDNQSKGIYSINSKELSKIIYENNYSVVVLFNNFCPSNDKIVQNLNDLKSDNLNLYIIDGNDQITINSYKENFDSIPTLDKLYMLDNNKYGNINRWHENGTINSRLEKFWTELSPDEAATMDFDGYPSVIVYDSDKNIIYTDEYFGCYDTNCKTKVDSLYIKINKAID